MPEENMIDVTDANVEDLIRAAYDLSRPLGLGQLHYKPGPLSDGEVAEIVASRVHRVIHMDYVNGRACKLGIFNSPDGTRRTIRNRWYDHSQDDLRELLSRCGISADVPPVAA